MMKMIPPLPFGLQGALSPGAVPRGPRFPSIVLYALLFLLVGGPGIPDSLGGVVRVAVQEEQLWEFRESGVRFSSDFPGARLNECTRTGEGKYRILIRPENTPINNSAWYAFDVASSRPQTITVTLAYQDGRHRYSPKISDDGGLTWTSLQRSAWRHNPEANEAVLRLEVGPQPIRVAGQEMIGSRELRGWIDEMAQKAFIQKATIGESLLGQSIEALRIGPAEPLNYVFIIGRQHPPELMGTLGLIHFVEHLSANSPLANRFRQHFQTVVIPLMNPDGVDRGHWRHNMAGVDLNRDWLKFAQPETRAARDLFTRLAAREGARPFLLLDFHSTHRDIFYTQKDEHPTSPENFTANWLGAIAERMPDYELSRSGSHSSNHVTSKAWGYEIFGIPSITYELGDHTDRDLIRRQTTIAAEEMMRLLLAEIGQEATVSPRPELQETPVSR
jgi:cytosolic carboxypeptidase protein 6